VNQVSDTDVLAITLIEQFCLLRVLSGEKYEIDEAASEMLMERAHIGVKILYQLLKKNFEMH
jgi:hypothetical protein